MPTCQLVLELHACRLRLLRVSGNGTLIDDVAPPALVLLARGSLRQAGRGSRGRIAKFSIPVGATAAEARQQLVLRTYASTSGDAARTGKVLGISEREVRGELLALVTGAAEPVREAEVVAKPVKKKEPAPPSRSPARKPTAKKGR